MNSLAFATISQLQDAINRKEVTVPEVVAYFSKRCAKYQDLGALLELFDAESIMKASNGHGALYGVPGVIKDNICQKGRITSCASKILANYHAPYDATATARLKEQGALLLGRANCDEFAMGSSGETSAYFKTKNPWDTSRVPGGSSSGSIAAVAAGLAQWSLGSETGGSVRQPAAFCNLVGLKPTYGLISRYGLIAYASSLDQIGIATRTVYDNALVLSAIAGHDRHDSSSLKVQPKDYTASLNFKLKDGLCIGVVENALHAEGMDSEVVAAIEDGIKILEQLGAKIKRIKLPAMDYSAAVYFIVSRAEAASNLARFDGVRYGMRAKDAQTLSEMYFKTRHDGFGPEVKSRIMVGNYVLSVGHADAYYNNAKMVQQLMRKEFVEAFAHVDLMLMPTHPAPAFKFGAFGDNPLQMDLQDYFTCAANLTGVPALNIPCGFSSNNLPIGFQFVGPDLSEDLLFQTAFAFEQTTQLFTKRPHGYDD